MGDINSLIRIVKEGLKNNLLQEWHSDVNESSTNIIITVSKVF